MIAHELSQGKLVVIAGGDKQQFALAREVLSIGRASYNDICLYWDPRVSRSHARLVLHNGVWILQDLGSTNGTFLETSRLEAPTVIRHGHRIRFGRVWLQVVMDEPGPLPTTTDTMDLKRQDEMPETYEDELEPVGELRLRSSPVVDVTPAAPAVSLERISDRGGEPQPMSQEQHAGPPPRRSGLLARLFGWVRPASKPSPAVPQPSPASASPLSHAAPPPPPVQPSPIEPATEASFEEATGDSPWLIEVPEPSEPEAPPAPEPTPTERAVAKVMESVLACEVPPLGVEIRAVASDASQPPDTHELRQIIADLNIPAQLSAQLRETLGNSDVFIALSAQEGAQGELLAVAGQVVARLYELPGYRDVLVTPRHNGH